ncbi:MAG: polymer-forming cytoskeletal protein, partial [Bacteroidetes bacterium]|nr:polymer-forming cytoskeletal protein [Bacteroidota bacterium]
ESKAVVRGDVKASKLVIDEGAVFDGKVTMTENRPAGQNY